MKYTWGGKQYLAQCKIRSRCILGHLKSLIDNFSIYDIVITQNEMSIFTVQVLSLMLWMNPSKQNWHYYHDLLTLVKEKCTLLSMNRIILVEIWPWIHVFVSLYEQCLICLMAIVIEIYNIVVVDDGSFLLISSQ